MRGPARRFLNLKWLTEVPVLGEVVCEGFGGRLHGKDVQRGKGGARDVEKAGR